MAGLRVNSDLAAAIVSFDSDGPISVSGPTGMSLVKGDVARVPLAFVDSDVVQEASYIVGSDGRVGRLTLSYYSRAYYESIGANTQPPALILSTDLPRTQRLTGSPGIDAAPSRADAFSPWAAAWDVARASGSIPTVEAGFRAAVGQLYAWFDAHNVEGSGPLCDASLSGYQTMAGVLSGACWVWCTGYAHILRGFLRSEGIPARAITLLPSITTLSDGVVVQSSDAHTTTEWWDGARWRWISPTFRVLGATDATGDPLSVRALIAALADPSARAGLSFTVWGGDTRAWVVAPFAQLDPALQDALGRYFTTDKRLSLDP